ncbi:hypothetical protein FRC19_007958 [Serendipita sp. 401]|nr:hypothetical protein FRC19_007958 [Serendipita sp. 401]KAG8863055.1 hypothetical protein FRC20_010882 [Serendipita sp. 405]
MAFHSTYRPPPPAPSAFFALHLASSSSSAAPLASITDSAPSSSAASSSSSTTTATASTHGLPRIPSKLSVHVTCQSIALQAAQQQHIDLKAAALASGKSAPSRNNSASSITALPSLSSSLNNLMQATSIDHLDVCGTHPAEADELLRRVIQGNVKRLSNPSMGPQPTLARTGSSSNNLHYQPSHHHHIQPERTFSRYSDDSDEDDDGSDDGSDGDGDQSSLGRHAQHLNQTGQSHHPVPLAPHADRSQSDIAYQQRSVSNADIKSGRLAPLPRSASSGGLVMNRSRRDRLGRTGTAAAFAF